MVLEAIRYTSGSLQILNQLKLPHQEEYDQITSSEDGWHAIKEMRTRGAPAIAIVAALALAVELNNTKTLQEASASEVATSTLEKLDYLVTSRPTAVNLADTARKLRKITENASSESNSTGASVIEAYCNAAAQMLVADVADNKGIGKYGAEWILKHADGEQVSVLTHCNTGYAHPSHIQLSFPILRAPVPSPQQATAPRSA